MATSTIGLSFPDGGIGDYSGILVHRLRRRFRDLVKWEVAATLENPLDINQEIDYLIEALSYSLGRPFCD